MKAIGFNKVMLAVTVCALALPVLADDTDQNQSASTVAPADFAWDAGLINLEEIRLGQAAQSKSQNKAVKKFATRMIRDHSKMEAQLAQIADSEGLQLPDTNTFYEVVSAPEEKPATEMMPESPQQKLINSQLDVQHLLSLREPQFDQAYVDAMVKGHDAAVEEFENASASLRDSALRKYAGKGLKNIRHHYEMAQRLQSQVSTSARINSAPSM
jgi:putative membrane protein